MGLLAYASLCLFGLLLSSPFPGAEAKSCPKDWMKDQGYCYGYFESEKTWAEAEIECQTYGPDTHLASILTESETDLVASYILLHKPKGSNVWIGLQDPYKNGRWRWTDESAFDYKAWGYGQPDNYRNQEYCVELMRYTGFKDWNDIYCKNTNAFICKQKL
ncbi:C-type lectin BpLec-like [Anolis sagrei]|uniref:C-type lectin BpLec-like n=1 Tax=Anolis sagrei TaxID=38937 RepID=UPI0035221589